MRLLAEGGYQPFHLHSTEWIWLVFAAACGLVAIVTGFVLMRGVLASDQGTPQHDRDRQGHPGGRPGLPDPAVQGHRHHRDPPGRPGVRHRQPGDPNPARRFQAHRPRPSACRACSGPWPSCSGPPCPDWPATSA